MNNVYHYELAKLLHTTILNKIPRPGFGFRPYYMFNINHPVISELEKRFRQSRGIIGKEPLSDNERSEFELSLVNNGLIREIERYCGIEYAETDLRSQSRSTTFKKDKAKAHCPPVQR